MKNITKWLAASVVFGLLSFATERADAIPLEMSYTNNSPNLLGTVIPGLQSGGQLNRDVAMTNDLLGMSLGYHFTDNLNRVYSRTNMSGAGLLQATVTGGVAVTGIVDGGAPISIDLSQYGTFQYLVARYDGPNGGVAVFNIAGLTGTIELYRYAKPEKVNGQFTGNLLGSNTAQQGYFLMSGWSLLNPTSVPDGGATVMLLGAALGALGIVRRYIMC
jgi:VPDSG-CTERM motif